MGGRTLQLHYAITYIWRSLRYPATACTCTTDSTKCPSPCCVHQEKTSLRNSTVDYVLSDARVDLEKAGGYAVHPEGNCCNPLRARRGIRREPRENSARAREHQYSTTEIQLRQMLQVYRSSSYSWSKWRSWRCHGFERIRYPPLDDSRSRPRDINEHPTVTGTFSQTKLCARSEGGRGIPIPEVAPSNWCIQTVGLLVKQQNLQCADGIDATALHSDRITQPSGRYPFVSNSLPREIYIQ